MKKLKTIYAVLALLFALQAPVISARSTNLTERFKLWLLNNEARALSAISFDQTVMQNFTDVFSFSPGLNDISLNAANQLWATHRKIYFLLDEIQHCFSVASRFGNGKLAVATLKARPEIYSVAPFNYSFPGAYSGLAKNLRKVFYSDLITALGLDPELDRNLAGRIKKARNNLSDKEFRLFTSYIETFSALFPGDKSGQMINLFLQESERENFAPGVAKLLTPELISSPENAAAIAQAKADSDASSDELEKLAEMIEILAESEEKVRQNTTQQASDTLEPPEPGVENLFNIWD